MQKSFLSTSMRTHHCGALRASHAGEGVRLCGWVSRLRDHGGVVFVNLRDRFGVTQVVFRPEAGEAHEAAAALKPESAVRLSGTVQRRPDGLENPAMDTGAIEVEGDRVEVLGPAETPPFVVAEEEAVSDEQRMKFRYLDLRRPGRLALLEARHRVASVCRRTLEDRGFLEVETPVLTRSTPEGARDYVVPSRVSRGKFYALPQSPQLFKQLLMVAGADRYFQIVKCFRDEDLRSDRQPEFTQLDVEMAFAGEEDVMETSEAVLENALAAAGAPPFAKPLMRIPFAEALRRFGTDKPDLRFGMDIQDVSGAVAACGFRVFENTLASGGVVRGLRVPGGASMSRKQIGETEAVGKEAGLKGLVSLKADAKGLSGSAARNMKASAVSRVREAFQAEAGDLLLLAAGEETPTAEGLGAVRLHAGRALGRVKEGLAACWVVDPPLFTRDPETGRPDPTHHPFTAPHEEDLDTLEADPFGARARAYDLVLNGHEIAGGSVRIHRRDVQNRIFSLLEIPPGRAQAKFGFLLEAFRYGPPPHAGIAFGFDRLAALLAGRDQIREVIAFPKTTRAVCPLTGAPSSLDPDQLEGLGIALLREKGEGEGEAG